MRITTEPTWHHHHHHHHHQQQQQHLTGEAAPALHFNRGARLADAIERRQSRLAAKLEQCIVCGKQEVEEGGWGLVGRVVE